MWACMHKTLTGKQLTQRPRQTCPANKLVETNTAAGSGCVSVSLTQFHPWQDVCEDTFGQAPTRPVSALCLQRPTVQTAPPPLRTVNEQTEPESHSQSCSNPANPHFPSSRLKYKLPPPLQTVRNRSEQKSHSRSCNNPAPQP